MPGTSPPLRAVAFNELAARLTAAHEACVERLAATQAAFGAAIAEERAFGAALADLLDRARRLGVEAAAHVEVATPSGRILDLGPTDVLMLDGVPLTWLHGDGRARPLGWASAGGRLLVDLALGKSLEHWPARELSQAVQQVRRVAEIGHAGLLGRGRDLRLEPQVRVSAGIEMRRIGDDMARGWQVTEEVTLDDVAPEILKRAAKGRGATKNAPKSLPVRVKNQELTDQTAEKGRPLPVARGSGASGEKEIREIARRIGLSEAKVRAMIAKAATGRRVRDAAEEGREPRES